MKRIILGLVACFAALGPAAPRAAAQQMEDPEARLAALGLTLPEPYLPIANYVRVARSGDLLFLGGHSDCDEPYETGKVGRDRTPEEGYEAARLTALCLLASLKAELGDLGRVRRIVRVFGVVNATDDFTGHSQVINGASDLFVDVFGERGRHARAAIGAASLPLGLMLEIEMIVEVGEPVSTTGGGAPRGPEEDVLAVVDAALERISAEDFIGLTDLMLEGAVTAAAGTSTRTGETFADIRAREASRAVSVSADLVERGFDPDIRISGPVAMVWIPYDFYRDGAWSHCGVDVFTLLRVEDSWRIATITYSVEQPPDCREHPDGPPGTP